MPWKAIIRDPEYQKLAGSLLVALLKYLPSILNRASIYHNSKRIRALEYQHKQHSMRRRH